MKHLTQSFFALSALVNTFSMNASAPHYTIRSQSVNVARQMVGIEEMKNKCDQDHRYGVFAVTPEYTQTFRSNRIAHCLFGDDILCEDSCGSFIKIQGSQVANRDDKAWLADYFGLPMDYNGQVSFKPMIRNCLVDFEYYVGLDGIAHGVYFDIHAPLTHTRWDLHAHEKKTTKGSLNYPYGYFSASEVTNSKLLNSALAFFSGAQAPTLSNGTNANNNPALPSTVTFQKLCCTRWASACDCPTLTKTLFSDIEMELGWNFWCNEDYLVGLNIRASIPTGNQPDTTYLFSPVIGAEGHWKLGSGLNFHAIFWRNEEHTSSFGFYLEAHVQHMFNTSQERCFDLCLSNTQASSGSANSRYMLAQKLEPIPTTGNRLANSNYQFANEFAPVANLTKANVDVKIAVEGDVAAKFAYVNGNFGWDIGYNFWGRSCEKICPKTECTPSTLDGKTWALKGDSQVYGYDNVTDADIALAASQSGATIHGGVNKFAVVATQTALDDQVRANTSNIDNARLAVNADGSNPVNVASSITTQQNTSIQPVALTTTMVNYSGTRGISNKLFTHLNYAWRDKEGWTPFVGVGAEVEFSGGSCSDSCNTSCSTTTNCNPCNTSCGSNNSCERCAPNQWGVWFKGGVAFN